MIEVGSKTDLHSKSKLEVCNCQQLQSRYRKLKDQYYDEKLQNLNLLRKNSFLKQKCTLNWRFSELISSADIPLLKTLLEVCIRKGMGMKSILGRIEDAINKRYSPENYDDTDMEKATLVLRIGGSRLLNVLHITVGLPSVSLTYPKNKVIAPNMISGVDSSFEDRLKNNSASYSPDETAVSSLKMDEIATEERLRWNKQEHKIHGFCYQHAHCHNTDFTDINSIANLHNLLNTKEVHKTKEDLVIVIGNCGDGGHVTPLLSLPSCCKEETNQFSVMINAVCNQTKVHVFATDGDATRRRVSVG